MCSSDLVKQNKGDDEVVKSNEYEALRDSMTQKIDKINEDLTGKLGQSSSHIFEELQHVETTQTLGEMLMSA